MTKAYGRRAFMKKLLRKTLKNKIFYLIVLLTAGLIVMNRIQMQRKKHGELVLYTAQRQNLLITVVEGGNLVALESQKIVNEVPGSRNILEVVDEGIEITEEDVRNGKILVKLDSKDLEDRLEQLKLSVENSLASYTEGEQNLEILKKQNESDITQAELKVKFAEMDLNKYLGDKLAQSIIGKSEKINFAVLIRSDNLGGEALNKKRALETKIDLTKEEVARAKDKVDWSLKLSEKGYVTKIELEADKLALQQKEVAREQAELEYELFLKYDFTKQVEKLLSDYEEAQLQLERVIGTTKARMIQSEANLFSRRRTYILNRNNLRDVEDNIKKCTIIATKQGFVTYATSGRPWASQSPIQPGTTIRQYQQLFELPDFRSMGVEIKVHESSIKKIKQGLPANVRIDAFPDVSLTGKVKKISLMPDSTIKFLNPDINVYVTQITLDDGGIEFLKPGMTAQVEILIKKLEDVLSVPVNAVFFKGGQSYCAVLKDGNLTEKKVELGDSSETMVEVKSGISEGEKVVIKPGAAITSAVRKAELEETGVFRREQDAGTEVPAQTSDMTVPAPVPQAVPAGPDAMESGGPAATAVGEGTRTERRRTTGAGTQRTRPPSGVTE
jgi:HlyD family secretion protein